MRSDKHKEKIIFVTPSFSSFVRNDIELFSKHYHLVINTYNWLNKSLTPVYLVRQLFYLLINIPKSKAIVVSFGGYWSFLPSVIGRILNVNVFIILHGTDCASIPEYGYGNLGKYPLRYFIKYSYKHAYKLLPVSSSLVKTHNSYTAKLSNREQGFKFHFKDLKTRYSVIPNGVDPEFWNVEKLEKSGQIDLPKQKCSFISVFSANQYYLKGGPLIVDLAKRMSNCKFIIAGMSAPAGIDYPDNLIYTGRKKQEELRELFAESQFYLQLSNYEGFGLSLCEAMLCGCIPIVSSVNVLPDIVGKAGFVLYKENIDDLVNLTLDILNRNDLDQLKKTARKRIVDNFTLKNREELLVSVIEND